MWMLRPIVDLGTITERQTTIEQLMNRPDIVKEVNAILRQVKDTPRTLQRLQQTQSCPDIKDFKLIMASIRHILQLQSSLQELASQGKVSNYVDNVWVVVITPSNYAGRLACSDTFTLGARWTVSRGALCWKCLSLRSHAAGRPSSNSLSEKKMRSLDANIQNLTLFLHSMIISHWGIQTAGNWAATLMIPAKVCASLSCASKPICCH